MINQRFFTTGKLISVVVVAIILTVTLGTPVAKVNAQTNPVDPGLIEFNPVTELELDATPYLSEDGLTAYNTVPPLILVDDPNPSTHGVRNPQSIEIQEAIAGISPAYSTFSINYVAAGGSDPWGAACQEVPVEAKTAIEAATSIWSRILWSQVPITISFCWSDLSDPNVLGYSGGQPAHRDFEGAPKTGVWYQGALANSLNSNDLDPSTYDDYITFNSKFSWYYGTDGNTPDGKHDLVTVALHEIGHGLNFSGSANYLLFFGSWGIDGYPAIYDTFMVDSTGKKLIEYRTPSLKLGSLLTSKKLWFNGKYAKKANGGNLVKMYAPRTWQSGSSYSHVDYSTFTGTSNSLMVYAISDGSSQHNVGNVIRGILQDMGWTIGKPIGFKTTFTGTMEGWSKIGPVRWYADATSIYTNSKYGYWSSAYYKKTPYTDFDFSARVKRTSDAHWANYITVRMGKGILDYGYDWFPGYIFGYTNSGYFSVFQMNSDGSYINIIPWTFTSAIKQYEWNILRVCSAGTWFDYYINGALVAEISSPSWNSGFVGFTTYKGEDTSSKFKVDWAALSLISTAEVSDQTLSPGQQQLIDEAIENGAPTSIEGYITK